MVNELLIAFGLIAPDYTGMVAAEAAYVLHTQKAPEETKCCGLCKDGRIVHGDGHSTECPCPPDCKCKTRGAVIHPPSVLKQCPTGKCTPPKR